MRQAGLTGVAVAGVSALGPGFSSASPGTAAVAKRYEYVFTDGKATVFDVAHGFRKVDTISLGALTTRIEGIAFAPPTGRLFVTYAGPPANPPHHGFVLCYDLVSRKVVWREPSPSGTGANSAEVTPNGRLLFVPAASNQTADPTWHVLDTATGHAIGAITGVGGRPHDTVVGLDGRKVYMGAISLNYLTVGDTATDVILRRVGPFGVGGPVGGGGVKPFTVNGRQTRAFVNVNGLLGFEVGDLTTGRSLFPRRPARQRLPVECHRQGSFARHIPVTR